MQEEAFGERTSTDKKEKGAIIDFKDKQTKMKNIVTSKHSLSRLL